MWFFEADVLATAPYCGLGWVIKSAVHVKEVGRKYLRDTHANEFGVYSFRFSFGAINV